MVSVGDWKATPSERSVWSGAAGLLRYVPSFILPSLAIAVLSVIAWASLTFEIPVYVFTRDMAVLAKLPPFFSITSSLGAFLMCATATCCLFTFSVARETGRQLPWHIFAVGLFSLYLVADDFYELHDRLLPRHFGIPQQLVYVLIAITAAAITFRWWREFLAFRPLLLAAALFFLGLSMGFDVFDLTLLAILQEWQFFWEDSAKLLGISLWATYFLSLSRRELCGAG
jgi:hypothetical protein